jgi:hypothetical protein
MIVTPRIQIVIQSCWSFGSAFVLWRGLHKAIMRPSPSLESEPELGPIFGHLFVGAALNRRAERRVVIWQDCLQR